MAVSLLFGRAWHTPQWGEWALLVGDTAATRIRDWLPPLHRLLPSRWSVARATPVWQAADDTS